MAGMPTSSFKKSAQDTVMWIRMNYYTDPEILLTNRIRIQGKKLIISMFFNKIQVLKFCLQKKVPVLTYKYAALEDIG